MANNTVTVDGGVFHVSKLRANDVVLVTYDTKAGYPTMDMNDVIKFTDALKDQLPANTKISVLPKNMSVRSCRINGGREFAEKFVHILGGRVIWPAE